MGTFPTELYSKEGKEELNKMDNNKEIKKARFVGKTKIADEMRKTLDCWRCPECLKLFHADKKTRGELIVCPVCREWINLDPFYLE